MKSKYQQFKEAIQSPPPERLAQIEYQSHFFQMLGISIVCIILIMRGYWYIIFAFIFGVGISYSQGMSAYVKYRNILSLVSPEPVEDYDKDISPTRRRSKIIYHVFGANAKWSSMIVAVSVPFFFIELAQSRIMFSLAYILMIIVLFILTYFFAFYWVAYQIYKKEVMVK